MKDLDFIAGLPAVLNDAECKSGRTAVKVPIKEYFRITYGDHSNVILSYAAGCVVNHCMQSLRRHSFTALDIKEWDVNLPDGTYDYVRRKDRDPVQTLGNTDSDYTYLGIDPAQPGSDTTVMTVNILKSREGKKVMKLDYDRVKLIEALTKAKAAYIELANGIAEAAVEKAEKTIISDLRSSSESNCFSHKTVTVDIPKDTPAVLAMYSGMIADLEIGFGESVCLDIGKMLSPDVMLQGNLSPVSININ